MRHKRYIQEITINRKRTCLYEAQVLVRNVFIRGEKAAGDVRYEASPRALDRWDLTMISCGP